MEKHHRTMTYKEKIVLAAEMINEGKTYRDVANAMQYKSEGSVSRVIRDAKTQGLIKTGSEWEREVLAEKERADKAEALARELAEALLLYEKWEADLLMDNSLWQSASGLPFITQEVWDELVAVQTERNKVLHKAKEVLGK